jgi:hypothetical protein
VFDQSSQPNQPTLCQGGSDAPLDRLCLLIFQRMLVRQVSGAEILQGFPIISSSSWVCGCPRGAAVAFFFRNILPIPSQRSAQASSPCTAFFSQDLSSSENPELGIASRSAAAGWPDTHPYYARLFGELLCSYTDAVTLTWVVLSSRCSDFPDFHDSWPSSAASCLPCWCCPSNQRCFADLRQTASSSYQQRDRGEREALVL